MFFKSRKSSFLWLYNHNSSSRAKLKDKDWILYEQAFEKYFINRGVSSNDKDVIPRKLHLIWFGRPIPQYYLDLLEIWKKKLFGWEIYLWDEAKASKITMTNQSYFDAAKNLGLKSDIFRYEILFQMGGVYVDTDFFAIKTLDDLLYLDFFTGTGHLSEAGVFNGLIGARKESKVILKCIESISRVGINESSDMDIINSTGPGLLSDTVKWSLQQNVEKIVVFPTVFFYPFPATLRKELDLIPVRSLGNRLKKYVTSETYCVHLWHTSWDEK